MQLIDFNDKTGNGPECEMKSGAQIAITVSQAPLANNGSRAWLAVPKNLLGLPVSFYTCLRAHKPRRN